MYMINQSQRQGKGRQLHLKTSFFQIKNELPQAGPEPLYPAAYRADVYQLSHHTCIHVQCTCTKNFSAFQPSLSSFHHLLLTLSLAPLLPFPPSLFSSPFVSPPPFSPPSSPLSSTLCASNSIHSYNTCTGTYTCIFCMCTSHTITSTPVPILLQESTPLSLSGQLLFHLFQLLTQSLSLRLVDNNHMYSTCT